VGKCVTFSEGRDFNTLKEETVVVVVVVVVVKQISKCPHR
jgi:hypothetical protein